MHSLNDLEAAEAELKRWNDAYANDRSNNPKKYEAQRRDARSAVRRILEDLKRQGVIERSESEKLNLLLDGLYPKAMSGTIIKYQGIMYRVRHIPLIKSRSGKTVKEWGHEWLAL